MTGKLQTNEKGQAAAWPMSLRGEPHRREPRPLPASAL